MKEMEALKQLQDELAIDIEQELSPDV